MEEIILKHLGEGLTAFFQHVNWLYTVCVLVASWAILTQTDKTNAKKEVKPKMATKWKVLIIGVVIAGAFILIWPKYRTPDEFGRMFFGIFTAMGLYKFGVHRFLKRKT